MSRNTARWTLLAIVGIFLVPLIAASMMWSGAVDWRPSGMSNNGTLLDPPRQLPLNALDQRGLRGNWLLVLDAGDACGEPCLERAHDLRQIDRASGRHSDKVQVVIRHDVTISGSDLYELRQLSPEFVLVEDADGSVGAQLGGPGSDAGHAWLADPQGLVILAYNPASDASGIHKDLKRLLTWSKAE